MLLVGAIKIVGNLVIGYGVTAFTNALTKSITPENAVKLTKTAIKIGGWAIGGVVAAAAGKKFSKEVDLVFDVAKKVKNKIENPENEESKKEKEAE